MKILQAPFAKRFAAHERAARAKRRMDAAILELESAEDEWHQACIECDRSEQATVDGQQSGD